MHSEGVAAITCLPESLTSAADSCQGAMPPSINVGDATLRVLRRRRRHAPEACPPAAIDSRLAYWPPPHEFSMLRRLAAERLRWLQAAASFSGSGAGPACGQGMPAAVDAVASFCSPASWHQQPTCLRRMLSSSAAGAAPGWPANGAPPPAVSADAAAKGGWPGPPPGVQLVRDFIHDSLYHPTEGYFSKQTATGAAVVGRLQQLLDFRSMQGQTQYLQAVQEQYQRLQASWLTPVEIFQPHYGRAVANCILQRWQAQRWQGEQGQQRNQAVASGLAASSAAAGERQQAGPPLRIYEIGGGTGTLARNILLPRKLPSLSFCLPPLRDWLRAEHPAAYASCRYTCIEISPVLAALQQQHVAVQAGHGGRFSVRRHDASDAAAWAAADAAEEAGSGEVAASSAQQAGQHCFIIMCEVLDNLPHDRVWRGEGGAGWQQTLVACSDFYAEQLPHGSETERECFELLAPVSDPLIARCLAALEQAGGAAGGSAAGRSAGSGRGGLGQVAMRAWRRMVGDATAAIRWLPTGCLQLLDTLHQARPRHTLIAADFNALPEVSVAGVSAPLVATTVGGATLDHGSYLVPRGSADIFFPTDFSLLAALYRQSAEEAAARRRHSSGSNGADSSSSGGSGTAAQQAAGQTWAAEERRQAGQAVQQAGEVEASYMSTAAFMSAHCPDLSATATLSGYNPLLEDYSNTAFFVGSST